MGVRKPQVKVLPSHCLTQEPFRFPRQAYVAEQFPGQLLKLLAVVQAAAQGPGTPSNGTLKRVRVVTH